VRWSSTPVHVGLDRVLDHGIAAAYHAPVDAHAVRVLVVEDHPLYRFALEHAIGGDARLDLVASFADGDEALEAIVRLAPDVVLLDLDLPGVDGFALLARLADGPYVRCAVILSADERGASVHRALALGARGYLSKDLDAKGICEAVLAAARNEVVVSRQLQMAVADEIRAQAIEKVPPLTDRERDVMHLASGGCSTAEIGRRLFISDSTVKTHLSSVYGKLGVKDRSAAIAQAVKRGLVSVD
jgi:DNA-binding NarL/FixJ family response regulator